ncbi:MAG TPA: flippase [Chloroflexota bacterium]|nr:flippase [Chloroflexota bacterium]
MRKARILKNLLIMGSGQVVTFLLSGIYVIVIGRYLGPGRLGELALATALVSIVRLVIGLGMNTLVTIHVARTPERGGVIVSAALIIRTILSLPAPIMILAYAYLAHINRVTTIAACILVINMLLSSLGALLLSMFQGRERMAYVAGTNVLQNALPLLYAGGIIFLLHGGVLAFAVAQTAMSGLILALNFRRAKAFIHFTLRVTPAIYREVITGGVLYWANSAFLTIYIYIDSVILGSVAGARAVGYYTPGMRLLSVALFVPTILQTVTLPLLSQLGVNAGTDYARVGRKTLTLLITCSVPVMIGVVTMAGPLIHRFFGPAYGPSVPTLMVLALTIPWTYLDSQYASLLIAQSKQRLWSIVMVTSCIVNPILNLILIPVAIHRWHNASLGSALALLCTEVLMAIYGTAVLRRVVLHGSIGRALIGTLVAGAAQAGILWIWGPQWLLIGEAIGAGVYAAVAITLGALPGRDVLMLLELVLRRPLKTLRQGRA